MPDCNDPRDTPCAEEPTRPITGADELHTASPSSQEPGITPPADARSAPQDYSGRMLVSYMVGIYVAVNAIRDAFLLVDGPDCAYMKTHYLQGNQDYLAHLTSVSGFHRVANTALRTAEMHKSREEIVRQLLMRMAGHNETGSVLLTSMPCLYITGVDYVRICRQIAHETGKQTIHIPGNSLSNDWLKGYEEALHSLATQISLDPVATDPHKVAIVGHLFDRNEEDNRGNIRELTRILRSLGIQPVSIWLSGDRLADLKKVQEAGTIISFPYGRRAAQSLARRTGARLIESSLPFGLTATETWVREIGHAFNAQDKAETLIDDELRRVIPKIEWVAPFLFQHRTFGFVGDPFLLEGFADILNLLGGRLQFAVITNTAAHMAESTLRNNGVPLMVEGTAHSVVRFLNQHRDVHCVVTNNTGLGLLAPERTALVEFGFPSFTQHALYDRPFLGFNGFLAFVDTIANRIRMVESHRNRGR